MATDAYLAHHWAVYVGSGGGTSTPAFADLSLGLKTLGLRGDVLVESIIPVDQTGVRHQLVKRSLTPDLGAIIPVADSHGLVDLMARGAGDPIDIVFDGHITSPAPDSMELFECVIREGSIESPTDNFVAIGGTFPPRDEPFTQPTPNDSRYKVRVTSSAISAVSSGGINPDALTDLRTNRTVRARRAGAVSGKRPAVLFIVHKVVRAGNDRTKIVITPTQSGKTFNTTWELEPVPQIFAIKDSILDSSGDEVPLVNATTFTVRYAPGSSTSQTNHCEVSCIQMEGMEG